MHCFAKLRYAIDSHKYFQVFNLVAAKRKYMICRLMIDFFIKWLFRIFVPVFVELSAVFISAASAPDYRTIWS